MKFIISGKTDYYGNVKFSLDFKCLYPALWSNIYNLEPLYFLLLDRLNIDKGEKFDEERVSLVESGYDLVNQYKARPLLILK